MKELLDSIALELFQKEQNTEAILLYSRISNFQLNGYPIWMGVIGVAGRRDYPEEIKKDDMLLLFSILHKKPQGFVLNYVAFKTEDQLMLWKKVFEIKKKTKEKLQQITVFKELIEKELAQLKLTDLF